jgi:serine protease AprX
MATPHLSGLIALMLEVNPAFTLDGVLDAITATARPMTVSDTSGVTRQHELCEVGAGSADARAAIARVAETAPPRTTVETRALPGWTGEVATAVAVPVAGVSLVAAEHNHSLDVPEGVSALRVRTDWGNPLLELDLEVYGPGGALVASSGESATSFEAVSIPPPVAGTSRVRLKRYTNTPTSDTGSAEVDRIVPLR